MSPKSLLYEHLVSLSIQEKPKIQMRAKGYVGIFKQKCLDKSWRDEKDLEMCQRSLLYIIPLSS